MWACYSRAASITMLSRGVVLKHMHTKLVRRSVLLVCLSISQSVYLVSVYLALCSVYQSVLYLSVSVCMLVCLLSFCPVVGASMVYSVFPVGEITLLLYVAYTNSCNVLYQCLCCNTKPTKQLGVNRYNQTDWEL